jgi:hypothetical protein
MDSRPEHGVVRRLMWEAAAFATEADEPETESPVTVPPAVDPLTEAERAGATPRRHGPGSQIRRYVPQPRIPPTPKPPAPGGSEPVKPRD